MVTSMSNNTVSDRKLRRAVINKLQNARKRMEVLQKNNHFYKIGLDQNGDNVHRENNERRSSVSCELNLRLMLSASHLGPEPAVFQNYILCLVSATYSTSNVRFIGMNTILTIALLP